MPPANTPTQTPIRTVGTLPVTSLAAGIPAKVMADRLGHSSVMLTLDTYSHATPAMDHAAADLIASLVKTPKNDLLAACWPLADSDDQTEGPGTQQARSDGVRRQGLEPRTRGLRVRCSAIELAAHAAVERLAGPRSRPEITWFHGSAEMRSGEHLGSMAVDQRRRNGHRSRRVSQSGTVDHPCRWTVRRASRRGTNGQSAAATRGSSTASGYSRWIEPSRHWSVHNMSSSPSVLTSTSAPRWESSNRANSGVVRRASE